ncbi:MAG: hypothetical protein M0R73_06410 [Dehalococcoidia bacterium]|nr:hypothetical protein [Dehalococcoidia bacterium]
MIVAIWLGLFALLFVLPLLWLVPRWGAPYPSVYRRRRGSRDGRTDVSDLDMRMDVAQEQRSEGRWRYWADILWLVLLVMVAWLVLIVWAG